MNEQYLCILILIFEYLFINETVFFALNLDNNLLSHIFLYVCMYLCLRSREKERVPKAETIRTVLASIVARYVPSLG